MNKKILIGLLLVALIGGIAIFYARSRSSNKTDQTSPTQEELDKMNAGDTTPTSEKEKPDETAPDEAGQSKKPATVVISQAEAGTDLVEVRVYANIFEDGTCTAIFTKGSETLKYTENTEQQAQYTQCNPFQIPKSDFSSGTWKVTVVFESKNYKGEASREFSI